MSIHFDKLFRSKRTDVRKQRLRIKEILTAKPSTISEIATMMFLDKKAILWNLLAMLRWGEVDIKEERDDEIVFTLTGI